MHHLIERLRRVHDHRRGEKREHWRPFWENEQDRIEGLIVELAMEDQVLGREYEEWLDSLAEVRK